MPLPDYKLIGTPFKPKKRGKTRGFYIQKYRLLSDPANKRRCVSLQVNDKTAAVGRVIKYVEKAILDSMPKTDEQIWANTGITQHLADYVELLKNEGKSAKHYFNIKARVTKIITGCKLTRVSDIKEITIKNWLTEYRIKKGDSIQTSQHYWKSLKAFTRWCWLQSRIESDPLGKVTGKLVKGDIQPTYFRRVFSPADIKLIFENAKHGRTNLKPEQQIRTYGLSGMDRMMLYCVAHGSGFRASELASLTPASFKLTGDKPFIELSAAVSKRRKRDQQAISTELAAKLIPYLATKDPMKLVWPGTWPKKCTAMLRMDMAGVDEVTAEGTLNFHSWRHTYITNIVETVQNPQMALNLSRLSTFKLLERYYHPKDEHRRAAVEALPSIPMPE